MKNMINSEPSMTSKEISELVSKRHDNVKRTIEKLAKDGVIRHPQIEDYERINNLGFLVTDKCYRFIGEQGSVSPAAVAVSRQTIHITSLVMVLAEPELKRVICWLYRCVGCVMTRCTRIPEHGKSRTAVSCCGWRERWQERQALVQ